MAKYNKKKLKKFDKNNWPGKLFKMSWIITPDTSSCAAPIFSNAPKTLKEHAIKVNNKLWKFYIKHSRRMGNILIIDFFQSSPIVDVVMHMNGIAN